MNRLLQVLTGKRIAIVGNGPLKENRSEEIDAADVVVRFNHFYNYDSGKVGKRVDVVLQTISKAWVETRDNRHIDIIHAQHPDIFLVKCFNNYSTLAHAIYGKDTRIDILTRFFDPWARYTTGTAALCYLANCLESAEVKCYGFQDDVEWERYIQGPASSYAPTALDERKAMLEAIACLEAKTITTGQVTIPQRIVIPVKRTSQGFPGKNRLLLSRCIEECQKTSLPITVVGDDDELLYTAHSQFGVDICAIAAIQPYSDVTNSLRQWRALSGYCGYVALVQCTSPKLNHEWITLCLEEQKHAAITATVTSLPFKANALFRESDGVYVPNSSTLPPASTARQLLPSVVRITGAVEAFHTDALDFESFFKGGVMKPVMIPPEYADDVDAPSDLK